MVSLGSEFSTGFLGTKGLSNRVPCFCYKGLPLVAFWRFYCINLVDDLISPLVDNTVHQATQLFIKIVEGDILNVNSAGMCLCCNV